MKRSWYYGIEGVRMIWHGEWADAEVEYDGMVVNESVLVDGLWELYKEECAEDGVVAEDGAEFEAWMLAHGETVKGDIFDLWSAMYDDGLVIDDDEEVFYNPQAADECDLVGMWKANGRHCYKASEDDGCVSLYREGSDCEAYADDIYKREIQGKDEVVWVNHYRHTTMPEKEVRERIKEAMELAEMLYED